MNGRAIQVWCNDREKQFGILLKASETCPYRELLILPAMSADDYRQAKESGATYREWLADNLLTHEYASIQIAGDMANLSHCEPLGFRLRCRGWTGFGFEAIPDISAPANMEMIL